MQFVRIFAKKRTLQAVRLETIQASSKNKYPAYLWLMSTCFTKTGHVIDVEELIFVAGLSSKLEKK